MCNPLSESPLKITKQNQKQRAQVLLLLLLLLFLLLRLPTKAFFLLRAGSSNTHTHTHTNQVFQTRKKQARYFFFSVSSSALNKTKLLQKHTKQSSSSNKTSLQNTHTHTKPKLFVSVEAYCHSTKQVLQKKHTQKRKPKLCFWELVTITQPNTRVFPLQIRNCKSSVIYVGTHLLPTQCTKKKAMHDEHIFLLLRHDLQNLAFVFSHHPDNLIKLTSLSLEEESLYSLKSLTYKFETGKQQQQKKNEICIYICIYILESVSSTPNLSRNQQKLH